MPSGSRPSLNFRLVAAAALALAFGPDAARAQQAAAPDAQLRAGDADATLRDIDAPADETPEQAQKRHARKDKARRAVVRLPTLQPYAKAQRLGLRGGPAVDPTAAYRDPPPVPGPTVAAIPPAPPRRRIPVEENPYDPLGVRLGDLKLTPYVEEDIGWASNPALIAGSPKGSWFETTEVGTKLQSDWSRNDLHGELKAGYTDDFAVPSQSAPYGSGVIGGRYDVSRDLSFDAEGRFNLAQTSLSSLGVGTSSATTSNPLMETFGGTVGGAQKFGDLTLALHGSLDRTAYQDVALTGAGISNLSDSDFNDWGLKGRVSYRVSEAISPFLEFGFDTRRYDSTFDANGFARDSNGVTGRVGVTVSFSQKLNGEASFGYSQRTYRDPRLPEAQAPLFDASLIWSATPLTTVTLKAQSAIGDAVLSGASADITRNYTIDLSHSLTRAFTLGADAGYATDTYVGDSLHDSTTSFGLKAEYHVSRNLVFKASATRQQFVSSAPNSNYNADVFLLGVRLQD